MHVNLTRKMIYHLTTSGISGNYVAAQALSIQSGAFELTLGYNMFDEVPVLIPKNEKFKQLKC